MGKKLFKLTRETKKNGVDDQSRTMTGSSENEKTAALRVFPPPGATTESRYDSESCYLTGTGFAVGI